MIAARKIKQEELQKLKKFDVKSTSPFDIAMGSELYVFNLPLELPDEDIENLIQPDFWLNIPTSVFQAFKD